MQLLSYQPGEVSATPPATDEDLYRIELTDEEVNAVMRKAKIEKYYRLKDQEVNDRKARFVQELKRPWTAQDQMNYLEVRAKELKLPFEVDMDNQYVVEALCRYFTGDLSFVSMGEQIGEKWSLNKGLLVFGNIGCGKTTLMRLFGRNKRCCYDYVKCSDVAGLFEQDGQMAIDALSDNRQDVRGPMNFFQDYWGRCFDDLGTEDVKVHYGNRRNVMADIISTRYHNMGRVPKHSTHITTNLTEAEIEQRYGSRVSDRLREMFNLINLPGGSRRK